MRLSYQKVGGLHFVKFGRLTFMVCRSKRRAPEASQSQVRVPTVRVLPPAAPFRLSCDGQLVLGFADEA